MILTASHLTSLKFNWEQGDECGSMEEFGAPLSVKYSFSNFSFKVKYISHNIVRRIRSLLHCIRVLSLSIYIFCVCGCDVQNISQLASMNYDLMTKHNNLDPLQSSR